MWVMYICIPANLKKNSIKTKSFRNIDYKV